MRKALIVIVALVLLFLVIVGLSNQKRNGAAEYLAENEIINERDSVEDYNLDNLASRVEVSSVGLALRGIDLPEDYTCQNYFDDISEDEPNDWACRAIEVAADEGIVSRRFDKPVGERLFRAKKIVSQAEALVILMNSVCYPKDELEEGVEVSEEWDAGHADLFRAAVSGGIFKKSSDFMPTEDATRAFVFDLAREFYDWKKANNGCGSQEIEPVTEEDLGEKMEGKDEEEMEESDEEMEDKDEDESEDHDDEEESDEE